MSAYDLSDLQEVSISGGFTVHKLTSNVAFYSFTPTSSRSLAAFASASAFCFLASVRYLALLFLDTAELAASLGVSRALYLYKVLMILQ